MKIKLYASVDLREWKPSFFFKGIRAGEIDGEANGEPAILVQSDYFPLGVNIQEIIVEFMKETKEILVDHDDDVELVGEGLIAEDATDYGGLKEGFDSTKYTMYGSYVKEIRADEIVGLHYGFFSDDETKFYVDGKWV